MLKVRLSRTGKKHEPHYRIVVAEGRSKRDGKQIDQVGHWHPKENKLVIDREAYGNWIKKGAWPTEAVKKLVTNL